MASSCSLRFIPSKSLMKSVSATTLFLLILLDCLQCGFCFTPPGFHNIHQIRSDVIPSSSVLWRQTQLNERKDSGMTAEERAIALEKATKAMTAFTNKYLDNTCTKLCVDKSVPSVVIKGLAEHKVTLGAPLCPCRFYDDKEKEARDGYWNCPCVPMRERHECHCMLFLTSENDFAGEETVRYKLKRMMNSKLVSCHNGISNEFTCFCA
jgi:ferredoxin-thioredoxin reductase catalytic chain